MKTKRKTPAEADDWKCEECNGVNPDHEPLCRKCLVGMRAGDMISTDAMIAEACLSTTEARERWNRLRTTGATDEELEAALTDVLGASGNRSTAAGPLCWAVQGERMNVWVRTLSPEGKPWSGADLYDDIRNLFRIRKVKANAGPTQSAAELVAIERSAPLDEIDPSPINPRQHFDPDKLKELAESLKRHGQLQNAVAFRKPDGRHELIAGERRLRAAKLAGLPDLRCRILPVTPEQAAELRHVENAKREDLTAIEQARSYEALLAFGMTQAQLAERLGVSQPQIANRLRLLRLPAEWQARVIRREIPEAHARELVSWSDLPAFLTEIDEQIQEEAGVPSLREWRRWIENALDSIGRPIKKDVWFHFSERKKGGIDYKNGRVLLTADDIEKNREALDLRDVPGRNDKTEPRAFNVALWWKLQATRQDEEKNADKSRDGEKAKVTPAANLTPKEQAAADKARRERSADMLKAKLARYKTAWYQKAIAAAVREPKRIDGAAVLRILVWFASESDWRGERKQALRTVLNDAFRVTAKGSPRETIAATGKPKNAEQLARETIAAWALLEPKEFNASWTPSTIAALADFAGVDLSKEWTVDAEFLALHSTEQLAPLVKDWKLAVDMKAKTRGELIDRILAAAANRKIPAPIGLQKA